MEEESKEAFIARIKRERGEEVSPEELDTEPVTNKVTGMIDKLKTTFFLFLLALFLYAIYFIFGMLKSN
jgi:hypothetical protein